MNLLEVERLNVRYGRRPGFLGAAGTEIQAAVGVSFCIRQGTTLGLVGESGSGKSTVARAILGLEEIASGEIVFGGDRISGLPEKAFRPYRKRIQMIFQDPFGSLDPRWTVGAIVAEPLQVHFPGLSRSERIDRTVGLLEKVGLNRDHRQRWPHQLSGGQRQRVGIARALAVEPDLVVCDEPVSALDVSVQAQVVNLLQDLQQELGLTYLFIAHDLAVVEHLSQEVVVMHQGRVVEAGPVAEVYGSPQSEYTRTLLAAVPSV